MTPKMDSLTPKTWEKSPNNIGIGPNFTYPVSRGLETGLAAPKMPHLLKLRRRYFLKHFLNTLCTIFCIKTFSSTGLETGCKPVLFYLERRLFTKMKKHRPTSKKNTDP